jgi:(p)ppGpp synthase/HD superfamily hydrolase
MNLERAIEIAVAAHKGMKDKGGNPYILHPLRIMISLTTEDERIVGVLHDVVEDCPEWTFERLQAEGFSERVLISLKSVTKDSNDNDYQAFVERAKSDPVGRMVKIADIKDNLDVTRIGDLRAEDIARINRYKKALQVLIDEQR